MGDGTLQPLIKFKYGCEFKFKHNNYKVEPLYAERPVIMFEEIVDESGFRFAGKHFWKSLTLRFEESEQLSVVLQKQLQDQMNFISLESDDYKFEVVTSLIDPRTNEVVEKWEIVGCFIETVNYNDLTSDLSTIELKIRFDHAMQVPPLTDHDRYDRAMRELV